MANCIDPDQTNLQEQSGSALFVYAILSETLVYSFKTFTVTRKNAFGTDKSWRGLNFE